MRSNSDFYQLIPRRWLEMRTHPIEWMLALSVWVLSSVAPAGAVENPTEWIRTIYAKYARQDVAGSALDLFKPEATERLKKAIASEEACIKRTKGICGLDFDPVANGQDFDIKNVAVTSHAKIRTTQPSQGWVTATFSNGGSTPQVIEYYFLQVRGAWRLDEVSDKTPGSEGWTLTKLLGKPS